MSTRQVLVVGNSHTRMIQRALATRQGAGTKPAGLTTEVCWVKGGSESTLGDFTVEEALEKIARLRETDILVLSLLGTAHNVIGMLKHDIPFAVLETVDGPVDAQADAQIIPMRTMQTYFESLTQRRKLVHQFLQAAPCPVFHFSPPPPRSGTLDTLPKRKPVEGEPPREYASRQNLLALWKLEQQVVQGFMTGLGIPTIAVPDGVVTSEGMLEDRFQAGDMAHANAAYGELMLQKFEKLTA